MPPIDADSALTAAALAVALVTAWRPVWALVLLLTVLPWASHHPAAPPSFWLVVLLAAFQGAYVLRTRPSIARAWTAIRTEPVLLTAGLFVMAAVLSLSSLPVLEFWRVRVAGAYTDAPTPWFVQLARILALSENDAEYPIKAVLLTLQAFVLALIVRREVRASSRAAVSLALALAGGSLLFIAAGMLEAFGVWDLTRVRGTEFVVYRDGTVQSSAGNPGWFSQYVAYALPYGLGVLAVAAAPSLGLLLLVVLVALHGVGLAAAFQRGGWLTGLVAVVYVAMLAPRLVRREADSSAASSRRTVWTAGLATGVAAIVVTGAWLWIASARPGSARPDLGAYVTRFLSIAQADRLVYSRVAFEMARLHPVLGGAHESFALRYYLYYQTDSGVLATSPNRVPDAAAGHSLYVQTLTGTGLVGLAALLAALAAALGVVARIVGRSDADPARRAVAAAAGGSLLAIAVYGLVQEVFYVHALRVLFFVGIGLVAGTAAATGIPPWSSRVSRRAFAALAVAFGVHLGYEYVWPGPDRLLAASATAGLGGEERGSAGETFRWAGIVATWPVPQGAKHFTARVRSVAPFPQTVTLIACGRTASSLALADQSWGRLEAPLDHCRAGQRVYLRTSPGWRPMGTGGLLGVMVSDVGLQ